MSVLDSIELISRKRIEDDRGCFLKVIDGHESNLAFKPGEVYLTLAKPGQVRGNHYHPLTSEWFTVVLGRARLVMSDPETTERREILLSADKPTTVYIPCGVGHAFVNPPGSYEDMLLLAFADRTFDPGDTIALDLV